MGMGGASLALADDATASEANPAGLVILTRPEVSLHGRSKSLDLQLDDPNAHFAVDFANELRLDVGAPALSADTIGTFDGSLTSGSFASVVVPFDRFVMSLYYMVPVDFEARTDFSLVEDAFADLYTTRQAFDLKQETVGLSIAAKLGDKVSAGLSIRTNELEVNSLQRFQVDYFRDLELLTGNLDHIDTFQFSQIVEGTDDDLTFNAGILINPNGRFSLGLVYKEGGEYTIAGSNEVFDCIDLPQFGLTCDPVTREGSFAFFESESTPRRFEMPDFMGLGLAWRPADRFVLALDLNHVTYSNLGPGPQDIQASGGVLETVDDALEVHFGLEYTFLLGSGKTPLSVRAGAFTEQDHDGYAHIDSEQIHTTVGLGAVIGGDFQIDLAGHFSETIDEVLLSAVYRF